MSLSPPELFKLSHRRYLLALLHKLPSRLEKLDPQRLLLLYLSVVGLDVLDALGEIGSARRSAIAKHVASCQCRKSGGLGAACRNQDLASADICTITMTHCGLYVLEILQVFDEAVTDHGLDLSMISQFLSSCQKTDGSFSAYPGSFERDVRFIYSAAVCRFLLERRGLRVQFDRSSAVSYVLLCQTHEGGFGGTHLCGEAHGGMTYCAVAALMLLDPSVIPDFLLPNTAVLEYCVSRIGSLYSSSEEVTLEAVGFQGRPNKPCDTCYSFWIGASLSILSRQLPGNPITDLDPKNLFCTSHVEKFSLLCQDVEETDEGGEHPVANRPVVMGIGKNAEECGDPLHTCLALQGLSLAGAGERLNLKEIDPVMGCTMGHRCLLGPTL